MEGAIYKNKKPVMVFITPALIFMVLFLYYPFVMNVINSFLEIKNMGGVAEGVNDPWYTNYVKLFQDPNIRTALKNTLFMIAGTIVFQVGMALVLALLVDNIRRGTKFFRTVYFFPIVISATALGLLFNLIFLYDKGLINQLREVFGAAELVDWKAGGWAIVTMMIPVMWQYIGFYFVIIVTGLNNIDAELYSAASIDGATGLQRIRYVTLPLLRPVIATSTLLAVTGALKVFDLPWVMFPKGMPLNTTWLTGTYMYYQVFHPMNVDYGSAIAVMIVLLGVLISVIVNLIFKKKNT